MPDSIAWSFSATASAGGSAKAAGKTTVDGVMIVRTTIPETESGDKVTLTLQLEAPENISFLSITSSAYKPDLELKSGDVTVNLSGPLVLHGDAVALFTEDLSTLEVKNPNGGDAELTILVGFDPTPP